jgi:hypothetical protein
MPMTKGKQALPPVVSQDEWQAAINVLHELVKSVSLALEMPR